MRAIARFADARNSAEGKVVSTALAALLSLSFLNVALFTDVAGATEGDDNTKSSDILSMDGEIITDSFSSQAEVQEESDPIEPSVYFDEETKTLTVKNMDAVVTADVAQYKTVAKHVRVENVGSIEKEAFAEFKMESVSIKDVKHVGYSFRSCTSLKTLDIDGVETIDQYAFYNPASLETVRINAVDTIGKNAFNVYNGTTSLSSVSFTDVRMIADQAFSGHKNLETLTFSNVGTIGFQAFMNCSSLAELNLVGNVGQVGTSAFLGCSGLTELKADGVEIGATAFYGCSGLKELSIKEVIAIGTSAFTGCTGLEQVTLEDIGVVGDGAFSSYGDIPSCTSLRTVSLTGVGTIGAQAFAKCSALETLEMTDIDHVGKNAFWNCTGLKSVSIDDVNTIGQYAFSNCTNLKTANITNVAVIDNYAFWYCSNLETISSLQNVSDRIGGFAFYGCENLTGLTVADLTKMGFIGSSESIAARVQAILAGKFQLDDAQAIATLEREDEWEVGDVHRSDNWSAYNNGTQLMEQARWNNVDAGVADVKVDAYYTGEKQMDYIFVADLSASMAQLGNPEDSNARFYDMQSKLMDMTSQLLKPDDGYDCKVAIVTFGGEHANNATSKSSGFMSDVNAAQTYIAGLEPLNENTDYGLGMGKALKLVQDNTGRSTVVIFLSDGAPNRNTSGDQNGTIAAGKIRNDYNVPIYGVLHSPTKTQEANAEAKMTAVCGEGNLFRSTNTDTFGEAMNKAFTAPYGDNIVTVPVNDEEFEIGNLRVNGLPANETQLEYDNGEIVWHLNGMPFTQHTLTYTMALKEELRDRVGSFSYRINNGRDARFGNTDGAHVGLDLVLSRSVAAPTPAPMGSYQVVHEYYTGNELDGAVTETLTATVGTQVQASDIAPRPAYNGNEYELTGSSGSLTVTAGNSGALVLRYYRAAGPVTPPTPGEPDTPVVPPNPTTPTTPSNPTEPVVPTVPAVTPAVPAAPSAATTPAATPATPAVAPAAAATPAEAPAPSTTEVIEDDPVPQAAAPAATSRNATDGADVAASAIADDETPMGAFDEPHCWAHWAMLLGIIATAIYGIAVVRRRLSMAEDIDDYENHVLGHSESTEVVSVPTASHQVL
ncbi:leucine-rich repeat protein [Adlercreutzia equolifaciens]|uniref:leucine-rich repeat protein n=1 Tax=Adlercreutzia equolifaciens TaxID=446660 RepID=UPI0003898A92|nr:leucine-rich repeat protein [Adlercreutzia equolifaciens]BAN78228.1 hypothetical protein AEQU_2259 [Adlercreutzia equolifaciens DSM 19450]